MQDFEQKNAKKVQNLTIGCILGVSEGDLAKIFSKSKTRRLAVKTAL